MDNFFTSIPLTDQWLNDHRTTIVGTLCKIKKSIPPNFLNSKDRMKPSSMYGFGEKKVLCAKIQEKIALILAKIPGLLQIITFYNKIKSSPNERGIFYWKNESQMANEVAFSMINIVDINSQII